ncbi:MAG: hypothetical protein KAV40_02395 [Thermoplasmatales archaeon]|nr:hypothetical protein [Thermoplasmatales archaeon]
MDLIVVNSFNKIVDLNGCFSLDVGVLREKRVVENYPIYPGKEKFANI